jgi:hypothetical protein
MSSETPSVRFPRQPRRGLLLGFSGPRVAAGIAAVLLIAGGFVGGSTKVVALAFVMAGILITSATIRAKGRYVVEWLLPYSHWLARGTTKQRTFRARITMSRPIGTLALPGDAARLRLVVNTDGSVYLHDPAVSTLTAALRLEHPAMVLLDGDAQAERVAGWSRLLSSLAGSPIVHHVSILEETIPDTGNGPIEWFREHWTRRDDWASREYYALLESSQYQSTTHRTTATITIRVGRRGLSDASTEMAAQRRGLEDAFAAAGLRIGTWLDESELAKQVRQAYAPFATPHVQSLAYAGPVAIDEAWGSLRHDNAVSCVLALAEFPAVPVGPQFLHSLIFSVGVRHTFTLLARVQTVDAALRQVRRDKIASASDRMQKRKIGQLEDMSDVTEYQAIEEREAALLQGHAAVQLTALVTVMAATQEELEAAIAQIKRDAGRCACEARVLYGMQSQAFVAAAVPVGRGV